MSHNGEKNPSLLIAAALSAELFPRAAVIGTIISGEDKRGALKGTVDMGFITSNYGDDSS